jgi:hypothetical protein
MISYNDRLGKDVLYLGSADETNFRIHDSVKHHTIEGIIASMLTGW